MFRFIAFLRAINVGGGRSVKMQYLRQVFESLGFSGVATFIASGNVVFETPMKKRKAPETKIERALKAALGYEVRTFVRGEADLAKIACYRPRKGPDMRTHRFSRAREGIKGASQP